MKQHRIIVLAIIFISIYGCKMDDRKFPEVKKLVEFKRTEFLPTLEHRISSDKNAIYCVTLLYAWDEIRKKIGQPITIDKSLVDLTLLNSSKSFSNVLQSNEYTISVIVEAGFIKAKAEFSKSLPFEHNLTSFTDKLSFAGKKVASFGQIGYNTHTSEIIEILYYKNDNDFIIKLLPKNKEHEMVFCKSNNTYKKMSDILSVIDSKIKIGKREKQSDKTSWRYYLNDDDEIVIPKFNFNIENNYSTIEGNNFNARNQDYVIDKAYQRTAFILDESGAEIDSEAEIELVAIDSVSGETKPRPKIMWFNKPFFVMLKRKDSNVPYFGLWTKNTELMLTEK